MSKTIRRKSRRLPSWYRFERYEDIYSDDGRCLGYRHIGKQVPAKDAKKNDALFHSDSWYKMGPRLSWRDEESIVRTHNKKELSKWLKDHDYEIQTIDQMPKDYSC